MNKYCMYRSQPVTIETGVKLNILIAVPRGRVVAGGDELINLLARYTSRGRSISITARTEGSSEGIEDSLGSVHKLYRIS